MDPILTMITPIEDTRLECRNVASWTLTFFKLRLIILKTRVASNYVVNIRPQDLHSGSREQNGIRIHTIPRRTPGKDSIVLPFNMATVTGHGNAENALTAPSKSNYKTIFLVGGGGGGGGGAGGGRCLLGTHELGQLNYIAYREISGFHLRTRPHLPPPPSGDSQLRRMS